MIQRLRTLRPFVSLLARCLLLLGVCATSAYAIEPFTIRDIRVEGVQRTEAGTVFTSR